MTKKGQVFIEALQTEESPKKMAEIISQFVNNLSLDSTQFIDELMSAPKIARMRFSTFSILWLRKLLFFKEMGFFDLRNQYSVETGAKLYQQLGELLEQFHPEYEGVVTFEELKKEKGEGLFFESIVIEHVAMDHRTLQQSFSGLVFHWLYEMEKVMPDDTYFSQIGQMVHHLMEPLFYKAPLI